MKTNDIYIHEIANEDLRETASMLHSFLLTYPGIQPKISYHIPFYYRRRWICYINLTKQQEVELAFTYGCLLNNLGGILKANGRKQVMGVCFKKESEIPYDKLNVLILNAIAIDDSKKIAPLKYKGNE